MENPMRLLDKRNLQATLGLAAVLAASAAPAADDTSRLRTRALAATCAQCHGTDGHAVAGEAMVRLAGLPQDYLLGQLMAFRSGQRPATIMHQITKGYSQEQLETLAAYFAAQK
jgi:sulfide dehydrogenase cytochrome subunit